MSESYVVERVGEPREWGSKAGGCFYAYPVRLKGVSEEVEWSRKTDSKAPQVGDEIVADLNPGPYGLKLQVDWDAMKGRNSGSGASKGETGGSGWQPESQRDPERSARILRQHSQSCAIEYAELLGDKPSLPELFALADSFDNDVHQTAAKAAQGSDGSPATPDPAPSTESDGDALPVLLELAGLSGEAARKVAAYANAELTEAQRKGAIEQLRNEPQRAQALERLKTLTEKHTGEPLPGYEPEDDIPF